MGNLSAGIPSSLGVDCKGRRIPWVDYPASLRTPAGWDRTESAPTRFGKVSRINSEPWPPSARNSVRDRVGMVSRFASERCPRWVGIRKNLSLTFILEKYEGGNIHIS